MISKTVNGAILLVLFMPLFYLLTSGIDAAFLYKSSLGIVDIFTSSKLFNSLWLALLVSMFSTLIGMLASLLYYQMKNQIIRNFFLLMILFLFATAPIIYTALLSEIKWFIALSPLIKSVIVLTLWLLPLASGIMILMMRTVDHSSLITTRFLALSKWLIFKEIIWKQSYTGLFGTFALIFMMVFIQEEVPSFFGYRTYAEEFLSRIVLMEKFESTLIYASPFVVFALGTAAALYFVLKKSSWRLFRDPITSLNKLNLISPEKLSYFGVLLFSAIALYIIFRLLNKVNFSLFTTLFGDNSAILWNSLFLAVSGAFIATLLCVYLVNRFNDRRSPSKMIFLIAFLSLYWFLPSSLTGLTLLKFSQLYYVESRMYDYVLLLYGYVLRVLSIGLIIMLILSQHAYGDHLFKLLNIPKYRHFFAIVLPMQWRKWLMVFGILFFLILNEITTTVLLVPPGFETLIVKIYNLMHYGDFETVAFLSLLQIALILVGLSLFAFTRGLYDKT